MAAVRRLLSIDGWPDAGRRQMRPNVLGNLTGQPPYRGTLKHAGWRARDYTLPAPAEGLDELVLAPAEVDLP